MIKRRSIVPLLIAALAVTGTVRADLTCVAPASTPVPPSVMRQAESVNPPSADACRLPLAAPRVPPAARSDALPFPLPAYQLPLPGDLDPLPLDSLPVEGVEDGQVCQAPPISILSDRQDSLVLCLYGLLGFGAFRSLSCVRKFSFAVIPDWYHSGGPAQIGHSLAIAPDCSVSTAVCCPVQPDRPPRGLVPEYYAGTIESLWRKSQFTPTTLAARGPPRRTL